MHMDLFLFGVGNLIKVDFTIYCWLLTVWRKQSITLLFWRLGCISWYCPVSLQRNLILTTRSYILLFLIAFKEFFFVSVGLFNFVDTCLGFDMQKRSPLSKEITRKGLRQVQLLLAIYAFIWLCSLGSLASSLSYWRWRILSVLQILLF